MQLTKVINDWVNRWFFVKEKKPRVLIGMSGVVVSVAVYFFIQHYTRTESFLVRVVFRLIGFAAALAISLILVLLACGTYNVCKKYLDKSHRNR
jgi:F0F1-type ATP synthase assembly protein I